MELKVVSLFIAFVVTTYGTAFSRTYDFTSAGQNFNCEFDTTGNICTIINYIGPLNEGPYYILYNGIFTLPNKVGDGLAKYTVTNFGNGTQNVFCDSNGALQYPEVTEEIFPASVAVIAANCSSGLPYLQQVFYSGTTPSIGQNAFSDCPELVYVGPVATPPSDPTTIRGYSIGDSAFENCPKLKSVILRDGLTKIGHRAFAGCKMLKTINIPRTVTEIADDAFVDSGLRYVILSRGQAPVSSIPRNVKVRIVEEGR
jgi:hypothetical protein